MKTKLALLGGLVAFLALSHYGWFRFFGPPSRWGTNVVVKLPAITERAAIDLASYRQELTMRKKDVGSKPELSLPHDSIPGAPFAEDSSPHCDLDVIQTHTGPQWGDGQHLFVRTSTHPAWTEILSVSLITAAGATVICPSGSPSILLTRRNAWYPYDEAYPRFFLSMFDRSLRSEYGIYQLDVEHQNLRFLFPGHSMASSPDGRYVAYMSSTNRWAGFHNVFVYEVEADRSVRILSLWESDPGSGTSFSYLWSADSKALLITGQARGWSSLADHRTNLHLAFFPETEQLFDMESP